MRRLPRSADVFNYGQAEATFAERFEADGDDWLFRSTLRSPPIRISEAERADVFRRFRRHYYTLLGAFVAGMMLAIGVLIWADVAFGRETGELELGALSVVGVAAFLFAWRWIWLAPARQFARRTPIGTGHDAATARRLAMDRISWGQLIGIWAMIVLLAVLNYLTADAGQWEQYFWPGLAAVMTAVALVQAIRKWRVPRDPGRPI